jgi:hypothetical protein
MPPSQSDAEVERLVQRSAVFRAVRACLLAADATAASSALAGAIPRRLPLRSFGGLLMTASLTHAVLEALVPAAAAPAGQYLFAVAGAVTGALLFGVSRSR